jgi:hypothetical protein
VEDVLEVTDVADIDLDIFSIGTMSGVVMQLEHITGDYWAQYRANFDDADRSGELMVQGIVTFDGNPFTMMITGGTGDFCGIQGSIIMSNIVPVVGQGNLYKAEVFRSDDKP